MKKLPPNPDLLVVAERVIWFQSPAEALEDPIHFMAYLLTYGTHEDVGIVRRYISDANIRQALDHAPPGIFDPRSWAYWHLMLDYPTTPPFPKRFP